MDFSLLSLFKEKEGHMVSSVTIELIYGIA
jgi:hypothetical protein